MSARWPSLLGLLAAAACAGQSDKSGAPVDSGDPVVGTDGGGDGSGGDGGDDGGDDGGNTWAQPDFASPPEAVDLDASEGAVHVALSAQPTSFDIVDWRVRQRISVDGHTYNGSHPAPTLRAAIGDTVRIDLDNLLGDPTTIHWHGLAVPFEMDGVPWMVDPVAPGGSFSYQFTVEKAGTYWYHPHFDTAAQVDRGLYGAFIVDDPDDPPVDQDLVLLLDDWREDQSIPVDASFVHGAHGSEGLWTVNGLTQPLLALTAGERVRLRLINASNQGYVYLSGDGADILVVARDQGLLPEPEWVDRELMAPGDRVEILWTPGNGLPVPVLEDVPYSLHGGEALGEAQSLLDVAVVGDAPAAAVDDWPSAPRAPTPDTVSPAFTYTFQGSAHTDDWMINGERFPDVTVQDVPSGETVVFEVRNLSATEHPFHLHGLHMELLSRDGVAPSQFTDTDNLNLGLYESVRLRTSADNVGAWMAHCHILPHGDGGMMTVLEVVE